MNSSGVKYLEMKLLCISLQLQCLSLCCRPDRKGLKSAQRKRMENELAALKEMNANGTYSLAALKGAIPLVKKSNKASTSKKPSKPPVDETKSKPNPPKPANREKQDKKPATVEQKVESSGGALFGVYDEDAGRESFAQALAEWRNVPTSQGGADKSTAETKERGGELLDGHYDEEANRRLFAQAVQEWRSGPTEEKGDDATSQQSTQEQGMQAQPLQNTSQADRIAQQLAFMDSASFLQRSSSDKAPNPNCFSRK
ncbi:hypothetical protein PROFUN_08034 [Planoprotostelium fungivorum]|uniref:Uncharacterized protein n=1 Tax=Planoprotostelium fungivorum TaxID=1890364 RepID=A0A2P6NKK0_9EUKA|nr:hypothetical protein PROFUN_08034 [Planoprotostelium fungivorum]